MQIESKYTDKVEGLQAFVDTLPDSVVISEGFYNTLEIHHNNQLFGFRLKDNEVLFIHLNRDREFRLVRKDDFKIELIFDERTKEHKARMFLGKNIAAYPFNLYIYLGVQPKEETPVSKWKLPKSNSK
ncbi:MAG: hypothetical protein COA82_03565 [Alkaliphilus sp.]|nr:MAG: hypothetical protein COA82_03565 [Alkaliphilus sp.]